MAPANCLKLRWRVSLLHKMLVRALFYLLVLTVDQWVNIWILQDACKRQTRNLRYVFLTTLSKFMWIPIMECVKCKKKRKIKCFVDSCVVLLDCPRYRSLMVWQYISIHGSVEFSVVENGALNGIKYRNEILNSI